MSKGPGRARGPWQKSRVRGESRKGFRDGIRREVGLVQTMSDVLFWQFLCADGASRVSRLLHICCEDPWARAEQRVSRTAVRVLSHPPCHLCSALGLGYECAAVWFGGGSSEPPHGLYGPKTPIAIPTSHRSVTSLALTEIGWRGT